MTVHLLDANVFIEAKRRHYAFDICPGFWVSLDWHARDGNWCSIDHVRAELERGQDDLAEWAKHPARSDWFCSTNDDDVVAWYGRVMGWVQANTNFTSAAKYQFAQGADPWLVAFAGAKNMLLTTHEGLVPNVRNRVPIPNVCQAMGVPWTDTFDMLRSFGVQLTWSPSAPPGR